MTTTFHPSFIDAHGPGDGNTVAGALARRGSTVAIAGSALWFAIAADSIVRPGAETIRDLLLLGPWTLLGVTLLIVHRLQQVRLGRWARVAAGVLALGVALGAAGMIGTGAGAEGFGRAMMAAGMAPFVGGLVATGVATVRAGVLRRSSGWLIATSQLLAVGTGILLSPWVPLEPNGSYSGGLAHAVVLLVVSADLRGLSRRAETMTGDL